MDKKLINKFYEIKKYIIKSYNNILDDALIDTYNIHNSQVKFNQALSEKFNELDTKVLKILKDESEEILTYQDVYGCNLGLHCVINRLEKCARYISKNNIAKSQKNIGGLTMEDYATQYGIDLADAPTTTLPSNKRKK